MKIKVLYLQYVTESVIYVPFCWFSEEYRGCMHDLFWPGIDFSYNGCQEQLDRGWDGLPQTWCFCASDRCNEDLQTLRNIPVSRNTPPSTRTPRVTTPSTTTTTTTTSTIRTTLSQQGNDSFTFPPKGGAGGENGIILPDAGGSTWKWSIRSNSYGFRLWLMRMRTRHVLGFVLCFSSLATTEVIVAGGGKHSFCFASIHNRINTCINDSSSERRTYIKQPR